MSHSFPAGVTYAGAGMHWPLWLAITVAPTVFVCGGIVLARWIGGWMERCAAEKQMLADLEQRSRDAGEEIVYFNQKIAGADQAVTAQSQTLASRVDLLAILRRAHAKLWCMNENLARESSLLEDMPAAREQAPAIRGHMHTAFKRLDAVLGQADATPGEMAAARGEALAAIGQADADFERTFATIERLAAAREDALATIGSVTAARRRARTISKWEVSSREDALALLKELRAAKELLREALAQTDDYIEQMAPDLAQMPDLHKMLRAARDKAFSFLEEVEKGLGEAEADAATALQQMGEALERTLGTRDPKILARLGVSEFLEALLGRLYGGEQREPLSGREASEFRHELVRRFLKGGPGGPAKDFRVSLVRAFCRIAERRAEKAMREGGPELWAAFPRRYLVERIHASIVSAAHGDKTHTPGASGWTQGHRDYTWSLFTSFKKVLPRAVAELACDGVRAHIQPAQSDQGAIDAVCEMAGPYMPQSPDSAAYDTMAALSPFFFDEVARGLGEIETSRL